MMIFFSWCSYVLDACFITFWKKSQPANQFRVVFSFKRIECCFSSALLHLSLCLTLLFSCSVMSAECQASLSLTISWSLLKLKSIESVMPPNHLIICHPLLLPSVLTSIRVFSNELALHIRWPKYWRFSFSISPSNKHWGLISFKIDWFDLLAVQGTLKSLFQHHSQVGFSVINGASLWDESRITNLHFAHGDCCVFSSVLYILTLQPFLVVIQQTEV